MSGSLRLNGSTSGFSEITAPDVAGDQTFTLPATGGEIAVNATLWEPLKNRFAYEDYQGALFLNGQSSDYSFADNRVHQTKYVSTQLYLGNGYIIPSDYADTIEWTTAIPGGAFQIILQSSNDRINWSDLVTSVNGVNTYTFTPGSQPVALRFRFNNNNGTDTDLVLADVKIPNMRPNQLVDQGTGGGCVVESSDWVDVGNGSHMFTKWADGTMICQYKNVGDLQSGTLEWSFPQPFTTTPGISYGGCRTIAAGQGEGDGLLRPAGNNNANRTRVKISYLQLSGYGNAYRYFGITAIGRWKS